MINQGPDLGCPATDNGRPAALCLCGRAGFGYGLRDCSRQACGPSGADADDAVSGVLAFGRSYCEEGMFPPLPPPPPPFCLCPYPHSPRPK